ncbi:MAG TPA: LPXTG cell wall anchor domain-containing protein, partial [Bacillota bacterium]|nr:LPXTG cell wall anchor domain-containing protein [Bacillota bacterium]
APTVAPTVAPTIVPTEVPIATPTSGVLGADRPSTAPAAAAVKTGDMITSFVSSAGILLLLGGMAIVIQKSRKKSY